MVIGNLKAAIIRSCWDDPQVQQSYRECAEHYGFLIAPCRPGTPEHKGKVEKGGVHYVKRILGQGLDAEVVPSRPASPSRPMTFARKAEELAGHVMGGGSFL